MPEIEPLKGVPDIFADDPHVVILWEKIGTISEIALRHMPRGLAYSVMLSALIRQVRDAYGPDTARQILSGFIQTSGDLT